MANDFNRLQVILKTAERCNLACDYCYYFYGGDESYKARPPLIKADVVSRLAAFLAEGCQDLNIPSISIAFHGGEPMLQKPSRFDETCQALLDAVGDRTVLSFSIQTNGTLITEKWLDVLAKHRVSVCISIDGLQEQHDAHRVDHHGKGSYARVVEGIRRIQEYRKRVPMEAPQLMAVVNSKFPIRPFVEFFHDEHGIEAFNFLLPDCNRDNGIPDGANAKEYGDLLCELIDLYEERPALRLRELELFFRRFQLAKLRPMPERPLEDVGFRGNQVVVVHSDGEISIDDTYMPASAWRNTLPRVRIEETRLRDYLGQEVFEHIDRLYATTPAACRDCCWRNVCNGGDLENRFSASGGFDNPSVYCDALKAFYRKGIQHLVAGGYPLELIVDRLTPATGTCERSYAL